MGTDIRAAVRRSDLVRVDPGPKAGVLQLCVMLSGAFLDLHAEIHDMLVDGEGS